MEKGYTVRVDLGDMVFWYELFAYNPQSALEIVANEKMSTDNHSSEFLRRLSDVVVSKIPYCSSVSNAQFVFDDKGIDIDIISNNLVNEETDP